MWSIYPNPTDYIFFYKTNFQNAAIWLRDNQRQDGSWPIEVEKELDGYPTVCNFFANAKNIFYTSYERYLCQT